MANKVGERPTGIAARVALALHAGISPALRADQPPNERLSARASTDSLELPDVSEPQPEGRVTTVDPELCARVRATIGITEQSFHASLGLQRGLQESNFAMVGSAGRSGAYFFLSPDQYYMLKTMSQKDLRCLRRILPSYAEHLEQHPMSLLPRYVAIFSLQLPRSRTMYFVCMTNVFSGVHEIHRRYDLKGSTKGCAPLSLHVVTCRYMSLHVVTCV